MPRKETHLNNPETIIKLMSHHNAINPNLPVKENVPNIATPCRGNDLCIQSTKAEDRWIGSTE